MIIDIHKQYVCQAESRKVTDYTTAAVAVAVALYTTTTATNC